MSRTEGITLPRLPTQHVRATSPRAVQPHPAVSSDRRSHRRRAISEPNYTAFVGTPRQDVPQHIYRDAAMFDDVFDKKGHLFHGRNTPKIVSPLNTLEYSSLHDPHCRRLFLNNKQLRFHLMHLGLITEDLRVVATTAEQRQKIRAHELLERKEQLLQKLEQQEECRINKLQKQTLLPSRYMKSICKAEESRERSKYIQKMKIEKLVKAEEEKKLLDERQREEKKQKLKEAMEEATLMDQARRNAARAQQEMAEFIAYQKQYGKYGQRIAAWKRDSDRIHNQMIALERRNWIKVHPQAGISMVESCPSEIDESASSVATETAPPPIELPSIAAPSHETSPQEDTEERKDEKTASLTQDSATVTQSDQVEGKSDLANTENKLESGAAMPTLDQKPAPAEISLPVISQTDSMAPSNKNETVIDQNISEELGGMSIDDDSTKTALPDGVAGEKTEEKDPSQESEHHRPDPTVVEDGEEAQMILLDPKEGTIQLTHILAEVLSREDSQGSGFITKDDFIKVLNSRDLGLQLNEDEIIYIVEQSDLYKSGYIPFIQVIPQLPELLRALYQRRAEQSEELYGIYPEEQWCELHPSGNEGVEWYLHKLTGSMQFGGRPHDFRPFLKDEVFEDAIVDFFETADENKDGLLEYKDLYELLVSPMVSTRVYSDQIDDLLTQFINSSSHGLMMMEDFVPIAKSLLIMIYKNSYPGEDEWIELESRKYGTFYFSKITGETFVSSLQSGGGQPPTIPIEKGESSGYTRTDNVDEKPRKKKHSRRVSWSDSATPSDQQTGPPPLRRRKSRESSKESSRRELSDTGSESISDSIPEEQ